jgi:ANTAR domain
MRLRGAVIGALNLFRADVGELQEADLFAAQALADVATIAILQHRVGLHAHVVNEQLNEALNSRIVIEQAKGVIAERAGIDMDGAFSRLRDHARSNNLRLADVARDIAEETLAVDALGRPRPTRARRQHRGGRHSP